MFYIYLSWLIPLLYAVTAGFYWLAFINKLPESHRVANRCFMLTLAAHLFTIIDFMIAFKRVPIATVSETFSTMVFLTAVVYWMLERRLRELSIGALLFPVFVLLLAIGNLTFRSREGTPDILGDVRFEIHVVAMLLAYGAFSISFIASMLYKLLAREMRQHELGVFYSRLPSLPFFEKISNTAIDSGVVFATIGLGLGLYFSRQVWGASILLEPKLFSAVITWLIYVAHSAGRRLFQFSGRRAATLSLVGFCFLMFSYLVISMLFTRVHHFA
jgi:ABC-type uncharacterized transport system permease subunit